MAENQKGKRKKPDSELVESSEQTPSKIAREEVESGTDSKKEILSSEDEVVSYETVLDSLDLSQSNYTSVRIKVLRGKLTLPSTIQTFECEEMLTSLALSSYPNLKTVKVERMKKGVLKLPASLEEFVCGYYLYKKGKIDWDDCKSLTTLKMSELNRSFSLPKSVRHFEAGYIRPGCWLNWRKKDQLETVEIKSCSGGVLLPKNLTYFKCGDTFSKSIINLSECENLEKIEMGRIDGALILPDTSENTRYALKSFHFGHISDMTLDLSRYVNLTDLHFPITEKGKVIPPDNIK